MSPLDPSQPLYQMEVLPGIGHDNLRSINMGQVLNYNYSQCQISKDGRYLLPDGVFLICIPIQQSSVSISAEHFQIDHQDNYTLTFFSLSVHGGFLHRTTVCQIFSGVHSYQVTYVQSGFKDYNVHI